MTSEALILRSSRGFRLIDILPLFMVVFVETEPARPIGEDSMASGFQPFFNRAFNVTGSPALSVCNGFSHTGLPLSLQIAGRPFEEALVLQVGHALERATGTRARRPVVADK